MEFSQNQKLLISCTVAAIRNKQDLVSFKDLTEFLGCYNYIPPAKRSLSFLLVKYLTEICMSLEPSAKDLFKVWLLADLIEVSLTEEQQEEVVSRLVEGDSKFKKSN